MRDKKTRIDGETSMVSLEIRLIGALDGISFLSCFLRFLFFFLFVSHNVFCISFFVIAAVINYQKSLEKNRENLANR